MIWPFKKRVKSFLGIDIGTSAIRVVELSKHGEQEKLENYASIPVSAPNSSFLKRAKRGELVFSAKRLSQMINLILKEARIESLQVAFSIPDFSTLFTGFSLPSMNEEEIPQAVQFEARRHVPLPLSEVTLGWLIAKGKPASHKKERLEILLVVVPNRVIDQYTKIAELCQLQIVALEAEVFSLQRVLARESKDTICLIDIGARSTTCSIVDEKVLRHSHSFDIAGNDFTERISGALNISYEKAEVLKQNIGLLENEQGIAQVLQPLLDLMLNKIKKVTGIFYEQEGKEVQSYILAGATGSLPGLEKYFSESLQVKVKTAFPFADMVYPSVLEKELRKIGPAFSVATGMAMKGLE